MKELKGKNIVLGVCGGIAAYKSCELVRLLKQEGANVTVIMTRSATEFIKPLTFDTLSGEETLTDLFSTEEKAHVRHISIADMADLLVVAPATANYIGKVSSGIADDLLTTTTMAMKAPVLIAPAMNVNMWENPILQENVERLKSKGYKFVEPGEGYLACGYEGKGRMAEPSEIMSSIKLILLRGDLRKKSFLVTAGPTREFIDPMRFISNRSSGKMGFAIAQSAKERGADVTLIAGPSSIEPPEGIEVIKVTSAEEMRKEVLKNIKRASVFISAAAVCDFKPSAPSSQKIKREGKGLKLELDETPDILKEVSRLGWKGTKVGFAAETSSHIENAVKKLKEKALDMIVLNDVGSKDFGAESDFNKVLIMFRDGRRIDLPLMTKKELAHRILDEIKPLL